MHAEGAGTQGRREEVCGVRRACPSPSDNRPTGRGNARARDRLSGRDTRLPPPTLLSLKRDGVTHARKYPWGGLGGRP